MRAVLLRSLAVIGVGAIVLAGVLYVATTFDGRPPSVLEVRLTAPVADDERVALINTSIEVAFSEPVEPESAEEAVRIEPAVAGAVSWSGSTMRITPADPLELETAYAVTIAAGIRDLAGNRMTEPPPPFEFVTAGRPSLVESVPEDGADEVPLDGPIALTFSTLMDTASVDDQLTLSPAFEHELRWSGELLEIVPTQPLEPGRDYEVSIGADAADAAGVTLDEPVSLAFRTVSPGLAAETIVPADGVDGIAPTAPIAVIFDRPIDPSSVSGDQLTISPDVAGTLEVVALPGDPPDDDGAGSLLRFTPSGPMPPNTTFEVELATGPATTTGETMGEPLTWTFTTGPPTAAVSNGIAFITDRGGVANVWFMNADGSGQRQVSVELEPVLDYAVAPDGSSLIVSDGRRLIYQLADGTDRRILTDDEHLEFDPTYSPDGQLVAFGRADAETGSRARTVGVAGRRRRRDRDRAPRGDRRGPIAVARSVGRAGVARAALRAGWAGARLRRPLRIDRHPRAPSRAADARSLCRRRRADLDAGLVRRAHHRVRRLGRRSGPGVRRAGHAPRQRPVRRGPPPLALGYLGRRAPLRRRVGGVRRRLRRPNPVRRSRRRVADRGQPERGARRAPR